MFNYLIGGKFMNKKLEARIARLEKLVKNEGMTASGLQDFIDRLANMNMSNQFDNGNFRWADALRILSWMTVWLDDEEMTSRDKLRLLKMLGGNFASYADLVDALVNVINDKINELTSVKSELSQIYDTAADFDRVLMEADK